MFSRRRRRSPQRTPSSLPRSPVPSRIFSPCQISGRIPNVARCGGVNFGERGPHRRRIFLGFLSCVRKWEMNAVKFRSMNGKMPMGLPEGGGGTHLSLYGQCRLLTLIQGSRAEIPIFSAAVSSVSFMHIHWSTHTLQGFRLRRWVCH